MRERGRKLLIIVLFGLFSLVIWPAHSMADVGWEDGTTQGWCGNVTNSASYYYTGQHSLALDLNLKGEGFKSTQTTLPHYTGEPGEPLAFKIYIPSTPEAPLDLKSQVYIRDFQGNIIRSPWSFLLTDRWNDLSFTIPAHFKGPFTLALVFGTQFQYQSRIYIDQTLEPSGPAPGDAIPAFYNTYIPLASGIGPQLIPAQFSQQRPVRIGGFGGLGSNGEEGGGVSQPLNAGGVSQPLNDVGGGEVIFEHKTFLLLSLGLFVFGLKLKK